VTPDFVLLSLYRYAHHDCNGGCGSHPRGARWLPHRGLRMTNEATRAPGRHCAARHAACDLAAQAEQRIPTCTTSLQEGRRSLLQPCVESAWTKPRGFKPHLYSLAQLSIALKNVSKVCERKDLTAWHHDRENVIAIPSQPDARHVICL
jgi:hypothetical protein